MFRLTGTSLFIVGLLLTASSAQDVKKEEDKAKDGPPTITGKGAKNPGPAVIPGDVEIHFLNGSKVRMVIQSEKLDIATAYGKLAVPVKDVRAIEFGLHFPEGMEAKIEAAIKALDSSVHLERERASKTLEELGPHSYPAVLDASRGGTSKEPEVLKRAKDILLKMQAKHPKKDLKVSVEDRVVTQNFTIVGRILTTTVKAKTEYFGEQELNLAKMRTLKAMGAVSLDMEFTLDAGKYANQNAWFDTTFQCDGRTALSVIATGHIDVWPQQGGQFTCGPSGYQNTRNGGGNGGMVKGGRKLGNVLNGNQHGGMLVAKIGEDGDIFLIGDRFEGLPEGEGKLFLHIGPSQWNCQCIGNFEIKINRKE